MDHFQQSGVGLENLNTDNLTVNEDALSQIDMKSIIDYQTTTYRRHHNPYDINRKTPDFNKKRSKQKISRTPTFSQTQNPNSTRSFAKDFSPRKPIFAKTKVYQSDLRSIIDQSKQ